MSDPCLFERRLATFFFVCTVVSTFSILYMHIDRSSYVPAHVNSRTHTVSYPCPDGTTVSVPYTLRHQLNDEMQLYIKPSIAYPFHPVDSYIASPGFAYAAMVCTGMCALLVYIVHASSLALKE